MPDFVPPQYFSDTIFEDVEDGGIAFLFDPPRGWANPTDCGNFPCTGPWNTYLRFEGTQYLGTIKPIIRLPIFQLIPDNPGFSPFMTDACAPNTKINGWYCVGFHKLGVLMFESLDADRMDRSMQPVYMRKKGS